MPYSVMTLPESDWQGLDRALAFFGGMGGDPEALQKAMEAGAGVDAAQFTGGRALGYESLDATLANVTWSEKNATLWRAIPKRSVNATVDQYVRRTAYGSRWSIAVPESSNPANQMATLQRAFIEMKYYRSYREVSDVSMLVSNTISAEAEEEQAGTREIIGRVNWDMYWSKQSALPNRIEGFFSLCADPSKNMVTYDNCGKILSGRENFEGLCADVASVGGHISHCFCNPLIAGDFSAAYASAERIGLVPQGPKGELYVGATIGGIMTAQGAIAWEQDLFNWIGWDYPTVAEGPNPPGAPVLVSAVAGGTGGTIPTGNYTYRISAVTEDGESTTVLSDVVAVTLGEKVTLTLTPADSRTTGFYVYRSQLGVTGAAADHRFLWQGARATAGNSTFVDDGFWVPGTAHVLMLDMEAAAGVCQWSQLMPLGKKKLAEVGPTRPFLLNLYGTLRVAKPEWCAVYRNILPKKHRDDTQRPWDPLGQYAS